MGILKTGIDSALSLDGYQFICFSDSATAVFSSLEDSSKGVYFNVFSVHAGKLVTLNVGTATIYYNSDGTFDEFYHRLDISDSELAVLKKGIDFIIDQCNSIKCQYEYSFNLSRISERW